MTTRHLAALLLVFALGTPVRAQYTWNQTTSGNWSTAAWTGGTPVGGPATTLTFPASGSASYTATNDIGAATFELNTLTVNNTGTGVVTIAGATTANTLTFAGTNPTINVTGTTLFLGRMAGSATVTKTGPGTFTHDSDNTGFTGTLIVNGGTFINQSTAVTVANFNPVSIVVNNGGTYQFGNATTGDPNLPNSTYVTVNPGGTVNWQEGETFGGFNLQGGTINFQQGGVTSSGTTVQAWTSGTLTGGAFTVAGANPIDKTTSGTVTISGSASIATTSTLNIFDGTIAMVNAANLGTAAVALGGVTTTGTFEYQGATATRAGAFGVNNLGGTISVTNPLTTLTLTGNFLGTAPLTKAGAGVLSLTGTLGNTGTTAVAAGTLRVQPVTAAGGFIVANGGTLAVAAGAGTASFSTPTLGLGGATSVVLFELGAAALPTAPLVTVTGANGLTTAGATLRLTNTQPFVNGTYTLIDYSGTAIATGFNLALPGRTAGSLVYNAANTSIDAAITGTDSIKWGGQINGNWDVGTGVNVGGTNNWRLVSNNASTNFINTDTVLFDDTASGFAVNLTGTVLPQSVTVNNSANAYTFAGPGKISGTTGLVKSGTSTLTVATDNDYTGVTAVTAGTLRLGNGGTTGSVVGNISVDAGATLAFNRSNDLSYAGVLSGAGAITKTGAGTVTLLANSNAFTGTLTVDGGTVLLDDLGAGGDLGATSIVINNGGKFVFGANGNADFPDATFITVNVGGELEFRQGETYGATRLAGGVFRMVGNNATISMTMNATAGPFLGYALESGTVVSTNTGTGSTVLNGGTAGAITKTTAGTVTFTGPFTYNDALPLDIQQGVLALEAAGVPATGTATVTLGAASTAGTLRLTDAAAATTPRPFVVSAGGGTVDIAAAGGTLTISGDVSGAGALTKTGPGTLALTAAAGTTYTGGTTVSQGTLRVANTTGSATGTGPVGVSGTGTLAGAGTVAGAITVTATGTVAPGTPGVTPLTGQAGASFAAGTALRIALTGTPSSAAANTGLSSGGTLPNPAANGFFDLGTSALTLNTAMNLVVDGTGATLSPGQPYSFAVARAGTVNLASPITDQTRFSSVGFLATGYSLTTSGGVVFLNFTPVPEPATVLGIAAAALGAARVLRRRKK